MSYAVSAALQEAVFQTLSSDPTLASLVGSAIFDRVQPGNVPNTYVSLGPEDVIDRSDKTGDGAEHRLIISVVTDRAGFQTAKEAAGAISDALNDADLALSRGRLVFLRFQRARARRAQKGGARRIDMTFRARVEDN